LFLFILCSPKLIVLLRKYVEKWQDSKTKDQSEKDEENGWQVQIVAKHSL
jgi:hypothetical protein